VPVRSDHHIAGSQVTAAGGLKREGGYSMAWPVPAAVGTANDGCTLRAVSEHEMSACCAASQQLRVSAQHALGIMHAAARHNINSAELGRAASVGDGG
jgi:hypothetical protein